MRKGGVKCPNCHIPFHRDMIQKFYMERIAPSEHAATYECGVPLEERKEMLSDFLKEVDTRFPDSVLDEEDRYPSSYDLRAELKHLLCFYLRREIADREEFVEYMQ
ncbi:hypothetical protein R1flu_027832 [Riccia fluitans]|uniref:LAGLIDADG homing endonuclease n=1 Tax=Riccia fluitans TaxID=41844 RepID=A0ABD1XJZ1_9MARC